MKKMISISLVCVMMLTIEASAFATEYQPLKAELPIFTIDTKYMTNEAYVEYTSDENKAIALVCDMNTMEVLEEYSETRKENETNSFAVMDVILEKSYNLTDNPATKLKVTANATVQKEVTASITRYYLIDVFAPDHDLSESDIFFLEAKRSSVRAFTTTNCDINIVGTLAATRDQIIDSKLDPVTLERLGFQVSGSEPPEWIFRKPYHTSIRIAV